jgi:hypothetical protein
MALPIGTALQHGVYVIDALWAEDSIGPLHLATHVPTGQWVQVRILGSRHPERIPSPEIRTQFYGFLAAINQLHHPGLASQFSGFEEDGVCYQVFSAQLGYPLARLVTPQTPMTPRQSLDCIQQIASTLEAIQPIGWSGLSLAADQLWQVPGQQDHQIVLTGFDFTQFAPAGWATASEGSSPVAAVVKQLSQLLYFLLTGQAVQNPQTSLTIDLNQRLADLHPAFGSAIQRGMAESGETPVPGLSEWLALLPPREALPVDSATRIASARPSSPLGQRPPAPLPSSQGQPSIGAGQKTGVVPGQQAQTVVAPARVVAARSSPTGWPSSVAAPAPPRRPGPVLALLGTSVVASLLGLVVGWHHRLQPTQLLSPNSFNPEQSFPPLADWPGDDPGAREVRTRPQRPDYGDAPPRSVPTSPVVADPVAPPVTAPQTPLPEVERPAVVEPEPDIWPSESQSPTPIPSEGAATPVIPEPSTNPEKLPPVDSTPAPAAVPTPAPVPTAAPPPAPIPIVPETPKVAPPPAPLVPAEPPAAPAPTTTSQQTPPPTDSSQSQSTPADLS